MSVSVEGNSVGCVRLEELFGPEVCMLSDGVAGGRLHPPGRHHEVILCTLRVKSRALPNVSIQIGLNVDLLLKFCFKKSRSNSLKF
jgi:hypothetical protein